MMATATFRFYAELNELLPRQWRQRDIAHAFRDPASVKDRIEAHGVPHTGVEFIQVNGEPVDFSCGVRDGDRAVQPLRGVQRRAAARGPGAGRGSALAGHAGVLPRVPRVPGLPPRVLGRVARPPDARVGGRVAVWIRPRDLVDSGPRACRGLPRRAPIAASASPPASRLLPRPYRTGTFAFSSTNQFWIRLMRVISAAGRRLVLVSRKRWPSRSRS